MKKEERKKEEKKSWESRVEECFELAQTKNQRGPTKPGRKRGRGKKVVEESYAADLIGAGALEISYHSFTHFTDKCRSSLPATDGHSSHCHCYRTVQLRREPLTTSTSNLAYSYLAYYGMRWLVNRRRRLPEWIFRTLSTAHGLSVGANGGAVCSSSAACGRGIHRSRRAQWG